MATALFTIHFATINTAVFTTLIFAAGLFTIHFATINTTFEEKLGFEVANLQYTLLLLIPA